LTTLSKQINNVCQLGFGDDGIDALMALVNVEVT